MRAEPGSSTAAGQPDALRLPPSLRDLSGAFNVPESVSGASDVRRRLGASPAASAPPAKGAYEARVLRGIWAAAPYLHNGSVASLAELLKPASQRKEKFRMGADFDVDNVGIAETQSQGDYERVTTGCDDLNSGNSRCGHEYGTSLGADEKKALIEYLKTL